MCRQFLSDHLCEASVHLGEGENGLSAITQLLCDCRGDADLPPEGLYVLLQGIHTRVKTGLEEVRKCEEKLKTAG